VSEILRVLDTVFDLHHELAALGWVAVDFYDGCLIYDFERQQLKVVDLDTYHRGPLVNEMGRMFGSTRFMAPEEFQRGAEINERTNVFTMGRSMAVFLSDGTLEQAPFRGSPALYEVMCGAARESPGERFESMAAFWSAWRNADQAA
jgi:serine/threonine-protein kinase